MSMGFCARYWQQTEASGPIRVTTLLRIYDTFRVPMASLVGGSGPELQRARACTIAPKSLNRLVKEPGEWPAGSSGEIDLAPLRSLETPCSEG